MTDTTEAKAGETFQLYVKNTSNCEGLPLQTFERLGPTWAGDKVRLPFGEPPDVECRDVVGWTDLFMGRPCPVSVSYVRWLPSNVPAITGGPTEPTEGFLAWGGNSGVRVFDDQAEPTPGLDDHLPRGYGRPLIWIEDPADLPEEVRQVVMTRQVEFFWLVSQLSPQDQKKVALSIMAMRDVEEGKLPPEVGQEHERLVKAQDLEGLSDFLIGLGYKEKGD